MAIRTKSKPPRVDVYLQEEVEERLRAHVDEHWPNCSGLRTRRHGKFLYVDLKPSDTEELEPLCRLTFTGEPEEWELSFFSWSGERYEPSVLFDGSWTGPPEACFDTVAALAFG